MIVVSLGNVSLLVAALLLLFVGAAHSYLGERYILVPLFRRGAAASSPESRPFTRRTLRFAWHVTTVAWWGAAAALWAMRDGSARAGVRALAVTFALTALVVLVGSRGRHLAWPVFLLIAIASWLGAPRA
jgi:hypothetical protein